MLLAPCLLSPVHGRTDEKKKAIQGQGEGVDQLQSSVKVVTPTEEEEIKQLLLATVGGRLGANAHNWRNPNVAGSFGYHAIQIGNLNLTGQRNPNKRLAILRQFVDFKDKVVVDLGCNVGGMLHHLAEVEYAYGFDYDARCVKAATRIAEVFHLPETFERADLNKFEPNVTFSNLKHKPDIVFLFNIGSWVGKWPQASGTLHSHTPLAQLYTAVLPLATCHLHSYTRQ